MRFAELSNVIAAVIFLQRQVFPATNGLNAFWFMRGKNVERVQCSTVIHGALIFASVPQSKKVRNNGAAVSATILAVTIYASLIS